MPWARRYSSGPAVELIRLSVIAVGWFMRGSWIRRVVDEDAVLAEAVREEAIVEEGIGEG